MSDPEDPPLSLPAAAEEAPWHQELAHLYHEVELAVDPSLCALRGVCCDFRVAEHTLFASTAEVEYLKAHLKIPSAEAPGLCPFWQKGLCFAREHRPLGCRTYFCDPSWRDRGEALHQRAHERLLDLHRRHDLPYRYAPWVESLQRSSPDSAEETHE